jgi:hypothetical protein
MFMLCEMMKWNHLPLSGGLYSQDPDLLDGFLIIFHERSIYEEQQAKKRERETGRSVSSKTRPRVAGYRR